MAGNNKADIAVPNMKLELVPVPVSDVDRAKAFYEKAGFKLNVDTQPTDTMRVVPVHPTWVSLFDCDGDWYARHF